MKRDVISTYLEELVKIWRERVNHYVHEGRSINTIVHMEFFNYISKLERMYKDPKTVYASVFVIMDVLEEERKPVRIIDRIYLDGMKHNLRLKLSNL